MEYLQYTDFRNHSKEYFDKIEDGESFVIIKRGKPVAEIKPFSAKSQGWKRSINRIKLNDTGRTTTEFIIEERDEE